MARLFADENFPLPAIEALRRLGHDVLSVDDIGRSGQRWSDPEVLEHATQEGRVLLTLNRRDFARLHLTHRDHAGMILCTVDLDFEGQAARIAAALEMNPNPRGLVLRVNRPAR